MPGLEIQHAVKQGCVRLYDALKFISEAMFTVMVSRTFDLEAAEETSWRLLLTVRSRLTVRAVITAMSASTTDVELRLEVGLKRRIRGF
jgi:hypothetical protein